MSRNLISRILVAIIFGPAIIWIGYQGGWWLFGMVTLLALVGLAEFLYREGYRPTRAPFWLCLLTMAALLAVFGNIMPKVISGYYMMAMTGQSGAIMVLLVSFTPVFLVLALFYAISGMLFAVGRRSPAELLTSHARLMWGMAYIGLLYPFVYLLGRMMDAQAMVGISGGEALLFLFGLLWLGDTAAMGVGHWLGKRKLAPTVSPNKTIAGFVGGIAGALVIGVVMIFWLFESIPWYHVLILALGCSVFGQLGDLVESMWKRSLGIKDSSAIIPGHGGVLDRFDSLLFAAPFMCLYFAFALLR